MALLKLLQQLKVLVLPLKPQVTPIGDVLQYIFFVLHFSIGLPSLTPPMAIKSRIWLQVMGSLWWWWWWWCRQWESNTFTSLPVLDALYKKTLAISNTKYLVRGSEGPKIWHDCPPEYQRRAYESSHNDTCM